MGSAVEVIDLCSSDESGRDDDELHNDNDNDNDNDNHDNGGRFPLDRMETNKRNRDAINDHARETFKRSTETSSTRATQERVIEIDLIENDADDDDTDCISFVHLDTDTLLPRNLLPRRKKFRGGGTGSSRCGVLQELTAISSAASTATSTSSGSKAKASSATNDSDAKPASAGAPVTAKRVILEKDRRANDTGVLHEGMMELLCQLNDEGSSSSSSGAIVPAANLCARRRAPLRAPAADSGGSSPSTVRLVQQRDDWSCAYRNLQMMLSALLPALPTHHAYYHGVPRRSSHVSIPSLGHIQSALQQAWGEGYDPKGAEHFRGRILGQAARLGAMEISAVMTYWGLDATVLQFILCPQSRSMLPRFVESYFAKALGREDCPRCGGTGSDGGGGRSPSTSAGGAAIGSFDVAKKLLQFAEASLRIEETCACPLLPLYLQWEGHSVTIVGYHVRNGCFLVLDPRRKVPRIVQDCKKSGGGVELPSSPPRHLWGTFQLDPRQLAGRDTQVILATHRSLSFAEKENRRLRSKVVTAAEKDVLQADAAASRSS